MAGLTVAERLLKERPGLDVAIIEPADKHDYQRLWTMVAGGVIRPEDSRRDKAALIPAGVTWIQSSIEALYPGYNTVAVQLGENISYDYLVVAPGMKLNWNAVVGLGEALGKDGVCSIYSYENATATWEIIHAIREGFALFTQPAGSIKCLSGSQQICFLADEQFRRRGIRDQMRLIFLSGERHLFPVKAYSEILEEVAIQKGVETHLGTELIEIRPATKEAVFRRLDGGEERVLRYDMIHVAPPMGPLDAFADSELADEAGWIEVDRHTLQHVRFSNAFGLGDAANLPTVRTGAAIRRQAPVLVSNLLAQMAGRPMTAKYDGFTACPIVTGYDQLLMAEFDYSRAPFWGNDIELLDLPRNLKNLE